MSDGADQTYCMNYPTLQSSNATRNNMSWLMHSVNELDSQSVENKTSIKTTGVRSKKTNNADDCSTNQSHNMDNRLPYYPISYQNKKISTKLSIKIPVESRNQAKQSRKDQYSEPQTPRWNNNSANQVYHWGDTLPNTTSTPNMVNVAIGTLNVSMNQRLHKTSVSNVLKDKISDINIHDGEDSEYESDKENGYSFVNHGVNRGCEFGAFKPFELTADAYIHRDNKMKKCDLRYQTPCANYQPFGDRNNLACKKDAQTLTRRGNISQTIVDERKHSHAYGRVAAPRRTILGLKSNV